MVSAQDGARGNDQVRVPKHDTILRDSRQHGNGLQHAVQAVTHLHNPTLIA